MFRILIVDDEPSVVDAITHTMPWEELNIEEVLCAYSAREALALTESQFVDIVISDIRMPGMDGLELLKELRRRSKRSRFILLTGHAEFEYAREAFKLQVAEYLLKPVRDEALIQAIHNITTELREEWMAVSSQQRTRDYLKQHIPALRSELLRNVLEGRTNLREMEEKIPVLNLPYGKGDGVYPVIIRLEDYVPEARDRYLMEYAIFNMAEEIVGAFFDLWTCKDVHDYLVMLVRVNPGHAGSSPADSVSRLLSQLQHHVQYYLGKSISIVYGRCDNFPADLRTAYESAVQTLRRRIGDDSGLLLSSILAQPEPEFKALFSLQAPPSLAHLFEAGLWDEAVSRLDAIFKELESGPVQLIHSDIMSEIYHTVLAACYHYAHSAGKTLTEVLDCEGEPRFLHPAEPAGSVAALKRWALEVCRRLSCSNKDEIIDARAALIKQVQEHIHVRLAEDVSLQTLAAQVDMHPVYLSKVYKLETGEGLKEYLLRVRMERAVHLLKNTDMKVYEIANQIGYLNAAYFIKVFKKEFGLTPQEYRDGSHAQEIRRSTHV
ncbi:response regulator [Paenibacillus dakarensis]|uniref:response regulator n=1 Tax=Paenibacillus dakarensis TaxID=1527293 RepID=UPI0009E9261F|nr:response regulator [Paenibacillus dakarensis]